uniref:Uncharacterized protein n=1 Tax=Knipowitschia caucasica TaxID=637954 RepID=A0AAV2JHW3_KNICA
MTAPPPRPGLDPVLIRSSPPVCPEPEIERRSVSLVWSAAFEMVRNSLVLVHRLCLDSAHTRLLASSASGLYSRDFQKRHGFTDKE